MSLQELWGETRDQLMDRCLSVSYRRVVTAHDINEVENFYTISRFIGFKAVKARLTPSSKAKCCNSKAGLGSHALTGCSSEVLLKLIESIPSENQMYFPGS